MRVCVCVYVDGCVWVRVCARACVRAGVYCRYPHNFRESSMSMIRKFIVMNRSVLLIDKKAKLIAAF